MGLPFLTMLAPSKRFYADTPRAPKTLLDWARQAAWQIHRWLPDRRIVIVGDTAFAAIEFLAAVRGYLSVVTRLRLDANLYAPAPPRRSGRGRPPIKGKRLAKLNQVLLDRRTIWQRHTVTLWYGRTNRIVELATGSAVWYRRVCRLCRFDGCWSAIPLANSSRRPHRSRRCARRYPPAVRLRLAA